VSSLESRFAEDEKPSIEELSEMQRQMSESLYLTEPRPVAMADVSATLGALYRAYAAPRVAGSSRETKGRILDRVIAMTRQTGTAVRRGAYIGDFIFDLVTEGKYPTAGEVLTFASGAKNTVPVEQDAGHFLYGIERSGIHGVAILKAPPQGAAAGLTKSYARVERWLREDDVRIIDADELSPQALGLALVSEGRP
jgi:hypothetical protein